MPSNPLAEPLAAAQFRSIFQGPILEEAAQVLGVSTPTAKRYWAYARAWLFQEIERLR